MNASLYEFLFHQWMPLDVSPVLAQSEFSSWLELGFILLIYLRSYKIRIMEETACRHLALALVLDFDVKSQQPVSPGILCVGH